MTNRVNSQFWPSKHQLKASTKYNWRRGREIRYDNANNGWCIYSMANTPKFSNHKVSVANASRKSLVSNETPCIDSSRVSLGYPIYVKLEETIGMRFPSNESAFQLKALPCMARSRSDRCKGLWSSREFHKVQKVGSSWRFYCESSYDPNISREHCTPIDIRMACGFLGGRIYCFDPFK